jgi:hypothetical protein
VADDVTVTATANKVAKRDGDGRLKVIAGDSDDEAVNLLQMTTALSQETIVRTVTAATTLAATDVGRIVMVEHASITAQVVVTVATNASVAIAVGSWIDICCPLAGGVKLTPAGGVTINGTTNVFPGYGMVRLLKTATNTWLGIPIGDQRQARLPKVRAYRTGGTSYSPGNWFFIPYDLFDATAGIGYNPDNEWFGLPGTGLPTGRRVICKKAGEYLVQCNFMSDTSALTHVRINLMVADNTLAGGRVLAQAPCLLMANLSTTVRLTAGQSVGTSHLSGPGSGDQADGSFDYRNDLTVTRIGD